MLEELIELRAKLTLEDEFLVEISDSLDFENLDSQFIKGMRHGIIHSIVMVTELIDDLE